MSKTLALYAVEIYGRFSKIS